MRHITYDMILVHIRSCMGHFGMNYEDYRGRLDRSMKAIPAGLPKYLLVDDRGFGNMVH